VHNAYTTTRSPRQTRIPGCPIHTRTLRMGGMHNAYTTTRSLLDAQTQSCISTITPTGAAPLA